ncbi:hypothetical protein [Flavobacterium sp. N2038]|jgi:hypothetical protein|uniref:hypothetical protein n=1 Tax=Flavobacterium sp. N2038 TaxID=2986829 RepID=UPI002224897A|nr:hypothetical protein [Flavobacterium sp. N2038]
MKSIYKIEESVFPENIETDENYTQKTNLLKGEIYSNESSSLLFQMYDHEEEDLFV